MTAQPQEIANLRSTAAGGATDILLPTTDCQVVWIWQLRATNCLLEFARLSCPREDASPLRPAWRGDFEQSRSVA